MNLKKFEAVGVGRRPSSTIRLGLKTIPREKVWLMETPQIVAKKILQKGLQIAKKEKIEATDELQLAELAGAKLKIIPASKNNFKITTLADLENSQKNERRVGLGIDSHRFETKKKALILGGAKISASGGLAANSDGDVLLHALTNAISSALGGGSLSNFADSMCRRGIKDSGKYLEVVLEKMRKAGFRIENCSINFEGKKPKLEKHFPKIRRNLTKVLEIKNERIGITATTGEELTAFGRGEGLQVVVLILLQK